MSEMSKRITDHDLERVLAGQTPVGRPELADVAASLAAFRAAAHEAAPQPSAALLARLDLPASTGAAAIELSPAGATARSSMTDTVTVATAQRVARPATRGRTRMLEFITGLSLAAKITAGTGALALSLAGVGAAGALPGPLQEAFDSAVTATVGAESTEEVVEEEVVVEEEGVDDGTTDEGAADETLPTGSDEFSAWVQEGAQADDKVGAEFGAEVSEQARELGEEKAAERGAGDDEGDDETDDETEDETEVDAEVEGGADVAPVTPGKP